MTKSPLNSNLELLGYREKPQGIEGLLFSGVKAGWPSPAEEFAENIDLQQLLIDNPVATFFVRAKGDSMRDAGIYDGDILIVDRSKPWRDKVIGLCCIDHQFTVKRVVRKGKAIILTSCNEDYPNIEVESEAELIFWGVVTWVLHKPG